MNKKNEIWGIVIGFIGALMGTFAVICFNNYVLMNLPLVLRMISMIVTYWLIAFVPILLFVREKGKLAELGFSKEKPGLQVLTGIGIAVVMSLVLTLVPHLVGVGEYVDNGHRYTEAWQFVFEFIYCIVGVAAVEELVFRGYLFSKFKKLADKEWVAFVGSSVLFGVLHIFSGNVIQLFMTMLLGLLWCFLRKKIKYCSTLSLIIAHGVYDALITVWASVLMK